MRPKTNMMSAPGEVEVDAHGFFVDVGGVAGDEAVEAHDASDDEEDEAEGDADVESHVKFPLLSCQFCRLEFINLRYRSVVLLTATEN